MTERRPLIAISTRPRAKGEVRAWPVTPAACMQYTYLESLWRAGCDEAMLAPRDCTVDDAKRILSRVDGLVLVGGGDIDPARYNQSAHDKVYDVEPQSDALEIALALAAVEIGTPMLAICRGMQVLNVALGGTLRQHITRQPGFQEHGDPSEGHALHSVSVAEGSALAACVSGASTIENCWSFHHQAIDTVATGLVATAWSDDGCVEAVETMTRGWVLGVQWHPERRSDVDPVQQSFFDELAHQSR